MLQMRGETLVITATVIDHSVQCVCVLLDQKPYYGGRVQCEVGDIVQHPSQLVCPTCVSQSDTRTTCRKHGREFIEYKCKFCCNTAVWYCWGSTHFCDKCHSAQMAGAFLNLKPASQLPQCNPKICPLRGKHPPAGTEFPIGCRLCKDLQSF
jgi:hypothetical protein